MQTKLSGFTITVRKQRIHLRNVQEVMELQRAIATAIHEAAISPNDPWCICWEHEPIKMEVRWDRPGQLRIGDAD